MKTSPSSKTSAFFPTLVIFLLFFSVTSTSGIVSPQSRLLRDSSRSIKKHDQSQNYVGQGKINGVRQSWNTVNNMQRQSQPAMFMCHQLHRIRYCPPFPTPPSPPSDYEIDPRYGVEKRLVPSGPNPLHN